MAMGEILGIRGGGGGEMRAFENCCLFKTGDTKWFPYFTFDEYILVIQILCLSTVDLQ